MVHDKILLRYTLWDDEIGMFVPKYWEKPPKWIACRYCGKSILNRAGMSWLIFPHVRACRKNNNKIKYENAKES